MVKLLGYAEAIGLVVLAGVVVWSAGYGLWHAYRTMLWDRRGYCPKCHQPFDVRDTGPVDQMYGPYVVTGLRCSRDGTKSTTLVSHTPDL